MAWKNIEDLKPERRIFRIGTLASVILVVIVIFLSLQYIQSQQLRQEMIDSQNRSYYITDTRCVYTVNETGEPAYRKTCPGEMSCFEPWQNGTNRCVKEGFTNNYCGNHSNAIVEQSRPADMKCIFEESLTRRITDRFSSATNFIQKFVNNIS